MKKTPYIKKLFRYAITLLGAAIGVGLVVLFLRFYLTVENVPQLSSWMMVGICIAVALLFAIICWFLAPAIIEKILGWSSGVERSLSDIPLSQIFFTAIGLIIGLVIATLITQLFRAGLPDPLWAGVSAVIYLMLGYLGALLGSRRWREAGAIFSGKFTRIDRSKSASTAEPSDSSVPKILDTSVLIDGRILDVCKTGFVDGPLVIPQFVLAELQHIADSSDPLRRNRGRRGLDILAQMQSELSIGVQITDADFEDVTEVDVKLLKLAQHTGGVVVTNDFNLNKVANVTGVKVLNLNDLAGALRPVLLPGEEMTVHILREGKEYGQGVGYLDDGTMIVVDNGKRFIGQTIDVVVTTVLQTSAGRMIFTRIKDAA